MVGRGLSLTSILSEVRQKCGGLSRLSLLLPIYNTGTILNIKKCLFGHLHIANQSIMQVTTVAISCFLGGVGVGNLM